ncbi:MAG: hypothetical protein HY964_03515 [Ignavibacteriales bacterium]|nr:hypothetical protein [Ignavibacteriales bacterium]
MYKQIKYIVDENGETKEVILPIKLWKKMVLDKENNKIIVFDKKKLSQYFGKIMLKVDPLKYQTAIRNEWR